VRGAGLIWSPLLQQTPRVSNQLMHVTDWLPTLYSAAGQCSSRLSSKQNIVPTPKSSVSIVTRLGAGRPGFNSRQGQGFFSSPPRPTHPPIQRVPWALYPGKKRPENESDSSPASSAEDKNAWSYTSIPQYVFMVWCLSDHRIRLHGVVLR
jgi:hypothetical protein